MAKGVQTILTESLGPPDDSHSYSLDRGRRCSTHAGRSGTGEVPTVWETNRSRREAREETRSGRWVEGSGDRGTELEETPTRKVTDNQTGKG